MAGRWLTLVGMIDDANNEIPGACFREEEYAAGYFQVLEQVCRHSLRLHFRPENYQVYFTIRQT
ncbi:MAG: hypothetical protein A2029_13660 [Chloroflexi bacterium RBG_19FT_COMBO_47_9]|nr:MAG: hypothetical protein A2029_13660 [Chloroflexi bacterium RBG_19FT_COMBO_47_9]